MNAYMKGAIGFFGCAAICTVSYQIGKHVGREEALREISYAELPIPSTAEIEKRLKIAQPIVVESEDTRESASTISIPQTALVPVIPKKRSRFMDKVRAIRELKDTVMEGGSVIKDILKNPDGKKMTMAVENDEAVIRISENK